MEAYSGLLERTRVPQPSFQRFAVIQIFEKLRSNPPHLNPDSDPGREAITQCLNSSSPAVVDQAVHELCRLVKRSKINISSALLELQSALEECNPRLVDVFVKGIGFLVRFGFHSGHFDGRGFVDAPENHPFVKVLCRPEVQNELVEQIVLFVVHSKQHGIQEVCEYLKPLVTFSILRGCSSGSFPSFWRLLISSLVSLYCSLLDEANPLFEMLISCLRCFPCGSIEDFTNAVIFSEFLVDAHMVVLRRLAAAGLVVDAAQLSGVKLLDSLLTVCLDFEKHSVGSKPILGLLGRLLSVWKELGLHYVSEMSYPALSLFAILIQLDLEDEGLYLLNLLRSFLRWKIEDGKKS
ncbi:hypothetical protein Cgig2_016746 [Carnegiea gigantea]|uniref:DUF3730 domain-containing protein n=1 Tax=Carnegiea gigantea TaxID=171969 RepID=A0A9Q1KYC6_9CARY|nr:hypothetical protein Cgig2_016746 [Carnegiea gigantea]